MTALITTLIDKQDTFEIVRDKIASILIIEGDNQVALAAAAAQDPDLWEFDVYLERSNPWETLKGAADAKPITNVWFDRCEAEKGRSNQFQRQNVDAIYNVDVVTRGTSQKLAGGGHISADEDAFLNAHRITRLVRNILMSAQYRYLDLRGVVAERWVENIESYRPEPKKDASSLNVGGIRISFGVRFKELSPQIPLGEIEEINVKLSRAEDGKVILESEFTQ